MLAGEPEAAAARTRHVSPKSRKALPHGTARFVMRREYFGYLLYDRLTARYLPYGPLLGESLDSCKSGSMKKHVSESHKKLVNLLRKDGITLDEISSSFTLIDSRLSDHRESLSFPLKAFISLTNRCSLRCIHCYASSGSEVSSPLTGAEWEKLVDELEARGCLQISIGGGEPLLREDIAQCIGYAKKKGLWVSLATNGHHIGAGHLESLREVDLVTLSIDGATKKTYESIRREGSFEEVLKGAALLGRSGIQWAVHFTVMKPNIHELPLIPGLMRELAARNLIITVVKPSGRACDEEHLLLEDDDLYLLDRMEGDLAAGNPWINIFALKNIHYHRRFGCLAANMKVGIRADGAVTPCDFLDAHYNSGNIRDGGLDTIWSSSPLFLLLRKLKGNPYCGSCHLYPSCRGGCRARALHWNGDWNSPDPYCTRRLFPGDAAMRTCSQPENFFSAMKRFSHTEM